MIFTTNMNYQERNAMFALLFLSNKYLVSIDLNPESVSVSVAVVKIVTAAGSH